MALLCFIGAAEWTLSHPVNLYSYTIVVVSMAVKNTIIVIRYYFPLSRYTTQAKYYQRTRLESVSAFCSVSESRERTSRRNGDGYAIFDFGNHRPIGSAEKISITVSFKIVSLNLNLSFITLTFVRFDAPNGERRTLPQFNRFSTSPDLYLPLSAPFNLFRQNGQ